MRTVPGVTQEILDSLTIECVASHLGNCIKTPRVMAVRIFQLMTEFIGETLKNLCNAGGDINEKSLAKFEKVAKEARYWYPIVAKQLEWAHEQQPKLDAFAKVSTLARSL